MENNLIKVKSLGDSNGILEVFEGRKKVYETNCLLGKNGVAMDKKEGDFKTPVGKFNLGLAFGTHNKDEFKNFDYQKLNRNLYWVDDVDSKYYNKLVDISKTEKDWKSAEHLIRYLTQYEYAIEIKANEKNIKGKGSAIFLHCSNGNATSGCVAMPKESMQYILKKCTKNDLIIIE